MGQFEEGDENDSNSIDDETLEEFNDDEETANIPFFSIMNSNYMQLKKLNMFLMEQF